MLYILLAVVPREDTGRVEPIADVHIISFQRVKSKFVCKLLLGTCGAKGCLASLS